MRRLARASLAFVCVSEVTVQATIRRFEKQKALYQWVAAFPAESIERLRTINAAATSAKHVLLALAFGICDSNIRRINRLIIQLLLTRMRAERAGDTHKLDAVNAKLSDIHLAIDWATGFVPPFDMREEQPDSPCNKFIRNEAA